MPAAATVIVPDVDVQASEADHPPKLEEQEMDQLAFELWQQASCPDHPVNENWMSDEEALRSHHSCL